MQVLTDWVLTPDRLAVHRLSATGVVADLHLGYDRARRRAGEAVPVRDLAGCLAPLARALRETEVRRLVVAGDLFEVGRAQWVAELVEEFGVWLEKERLELVAVVPGNHDRGLGVASGLPLYPEGIELGGWRVVHGDGDPVDGRVVQGHEHPWLRWSARVGGPCYLATTNHLVLPAFSPDAAGVNVLGSSRWARYRAYVVAGDEVLDFGEVRGLPRG
jgi:putative SbcD/Mre11-related phosphoesterase